MLRLIVGGGGGRVGCVEIANVGGAGAYYDYAAVVYDGEDEPVSMAMIERYARWSAPPHDLVLRAVVLALWGTEECPDLRRCVMAAKAPPVMQATLRLEPPFGPARTVAEWNVVRQGYFTEDVEGALVDAGAMPSSIDGRLPVWSALALLWCYRLGGGFCVPLRQPPVGLPLHKHDRRTYVRARDLPWYLRVAFERRHRHATRPMVPGVPDAYYPWDLEAFLGYAPWLRQKKVS